MLGRRCHLNVAAGDERLSDEETYVAVLTCLRNRQPLERGMIADVVRRVPMRGLPEEFAAIEIDGGNQAVRWFHQRQPLHVQRRNLWCPRRGWRRPRQILARAVTGVRGAAIAW